MCVLIRHTFCESLVKICAAKRKCHSFLVRYFLDIGHCCRPAQKNGLENQKFGHTKHNLIDSTSSKHFRPLHKLGKSGSHSPSTDDRYRISELPTGRYFLDLSETCLYMVHFGLGPFFRKLQESCLHRFPKSKPKIEFSDCHE